ncbi:hypothetical protein MMC06_003640 [Schaereria dolodes]|nr:hypothetical protein [Schaereria dolodes]
MENKAEDEYIKRSKLAEAANVQNGVRPVREERRGEWARESRRLMNSTESSEMQEEVSVEEMIGAVAPASKRKRPAIANEAYLEAELLELEIIQKSLGVHGRKRREVKKLGTA